MKWMPIKRLDGRFLISENGDIKNTKTGNILKQNTINGYLCVVVRMGGRDSQSFALKAHREVAIAFISNPDNKEQVNHIDGNKLNNVVTNLEWVTAKENIRHAFDTGLATARCGENIGNAVLTEDLILKIRSEYIPRDRTYGLRALARKYGFSHNTMSNALNGITWEHTLTQRQPNGKLPT